MKKINESNQTDTNSLINSNYSTKKSEYDDVLFKRDPNFLEMLLKEFSFELKKIKKPKERVRLENDITNYLWEESTFEINSHNVLLLEKIEFMTGDILATTLRGLRRNITEYQLKNYAELKQFVLINKAKRKKLSLLINIRSSNDMSSISCSKSKQRTVTPRFASTRSRAFDK